MRVRIIYRDEIGESAESSPFSAPGLFSDVFVCQQSRWPSLAASAAVHAIGLALIPTLVQFLAGFGSTEPEWATYRAELLRLEIPDHLYMPVVHLNANAQKRADKQAVARPSPSQRSSSTQVEAQAGLSPRGSVPRRLGLPTTQHISDQAPVILQPNPVTLPAAAIPALPSMAFWTAAPEPPQRRRAVIPGRMRESTALPNMDAPPVLRLSTPQPNASDIAAQLVETHVVPKLPLPNASTNPVRIQGKGGTEIASFDVSQSDPVNLIYLMADNAQAKQAEIPRGLQNTPRQAAEGGTGMTAARAPENSEKPAKSANAADAALNRAAAGTGAAARTPDAGGAAKAASGTHTAAAAAGESPTTPAPTGASPTAATPAKASNTPAGAGRQETAVAANERPGATAAAAAAAAEHSAAPAGARPPAAGQTGGEVIRMTHPSNGNFDVVILQSVSRDDLADIGVTLSGNPVYTVYLTVGDAREWLLEYCIPARANSRPTSYQVNVEDPGAVSAPYPIATVIPRNVVDLPHPKNIVLHGVLSAAGVLRDVNGSNMENALIREVLPLLGQWQFRPALRDQVPVEVEVLLIIPART